MKPPVCITGIITVLRIICGYTVLEIPQSGRVKYSTKYKKIIDCYIFLSEIYSLISASFFIYKAMPDNIIHTGRASKKGSDQLIVHRGIDCVYSVTIS